MRERQESAEPVFVDRTGRRRRLFAAAGAAGGVLLLLASLTLMAGFTGTSAAKLPMLPGPAASTARIATSKARPAATIRSTGSPPPRTTTRPTSAPTASTAPATTGPPPGVTPSPTHTNHRKVPIHKPTKPA